MRARITVIAPLLAVVALTAACGSSGSSGTGGGSSASSGNASGGSKCAPVAGDKLVVLEDDKHLQNADNVVPILRTQKVNDEIKNLWNSISTKLTTDDLVSMNKKADVDKADPATLADQWLRDHGF
jgi:osmoprotectant transport system substrate-binding protein